MRSKKEHREDLTTIKNNWNEFARSDPLWSILPLPDKKDNKWTLTDFFESGVNEVADVLARLREKSITVNFGKVLDFGCGVGRLTQAFAGHFAACVGVDISERMIELAGEYNKHGDQCQYLVNDTDDLKIFKENDFDFIYSNIVFQHMPPGHTMAYLKEFIRIIKPKGRIVFQITTDEYPIVGTKLRNLFHRLAPKSIRQYYKKMKYGTWAIKNMYCIEEHALEEFLTECGGLIIDKLADPSSLPRYKGYRYCVTK